MVSDYYVKYPISSNIQYIKDNKGVIPLNMGTSRKERMGK